MIYGIWGVISTVMLIPTLPYLLGAGKREDQGWVEAGDAAALPVGVPTELTFLKMRVDGWKRTTENTTAWLIKSESGEVIAFAPLCTHLRCAYHWNTEGKSFACPCHDSFFSKDGEVISGPAPRPLDRYEVRLEGNRIWLGEIHDSTEVTA